MTLELGGKCPVVIAPEADFKHAAARVAFGKTSNAGQICLFLDYVLVPAGREHEFTDAITCVITKLNPRLFHNADYTSIIIQRHHQRLHAFLDDARDKGAEIIVINSADEDSAQQLHHKVAPLPLINGSGGMRVMQEESFGPLLPIVGYRDLDEAIAFVNARPRS